MTITSFRNLLLGSCLAALVAPLSAQDKPQGLTGDSGSAPVKKKLINRGWGAPSVEAFKEHQKLIEDSPFDGVAIRFNLKDDEGKNVPVFAGGMNRPWKKEWFQPQVDILKSTKSPLLAESFISTSLAVAPAEFADAFDDAGWANLVGHFRYMAWAAKQAGMKGIMLDTEAYSSTLVKFAAATQKDKTFDEYAAKVRQRGRELMQAMAEEYPDMTLFTLFLLGGNGMGFAPDLRDNIDSPRNYYNLLPAFANGLLDAAPPTMTIVDGMEHSYPHSTEIAYLRRANASRNRALNLVAEENRQKYRAQVQAGLAIYMDAFLVNGKDVHSDVYTDPPLAEGETLADRLKQSAIDALETVDEYVWVFDERKRFWPTDGKRTDPEYWDDYIPGAVAALKEAKDPLQRQIFRANREFDISEHKAGIRGIAMKNLVTDGDFLPVPPAPKGKPPEPAPTPAAAPAPNAKPTPTPPPVQTWVAKSKDGTLERNNDGNRDPGSLRLKATTDGTWEQVVPVTPGTAYKARASVRQIGAGTAEVRFIWQDAEGKTLGTTTAKPLTSPNESWAKIEATLIAPPKAANLVYQLTAKGQKPERSMMWYDHVQLYRIGLN